MRIFGLAGWSGSGKTTLMTALIPEFVSRGLTVSTIKHAHHSFDIDQPGKDSWHHRQAGAREVMVASGRRWALMHELRGETEPSLDELLVRMTPVDLLQDANGKPIVIQGIWSLKPGNVSPSSLDPDDAPAAQVYFTAGPNNETAGRFGYLTAVSAELTQGSDQ